ncbi:hypothetical protein C8J56DRAFT_136562 [Mycena floridula]|nr:hypothetical protein C8J56DRAFT_136562 [Mycena floridula]
MFRKTSRKLWKQALWWTRVKLVYTRITLTKFTTFYFFLALINCIILVILQSLTFADNFEAGSIVTKILSHGNVTSGLTIIDHGTLQFCTGTPKTANANCQPLVANITFSVADPSPQLEPRKTKSIKDSYGMTTGVRVGTDVLDEACVKSFLWLGDVLRDSRREDVVTLAFQIWSFSLSLVAILNESLPHLIAALLTHILGTAWGAFRVSNSRHLEKLYLDLIVDGTCHNVDLLGGWWDLRVQHTLPVIIVNVVTLLIACFLTAKLFKVYAAQTFNRVGASPEVNKIYKMVLLLSVFLQLAAFFTLGASGMWIDKISTGTIRQIAEPWPLYIAAFAATAILEVPWLVLGWRSVRRENRTQFIVFSVFSAMIFILLTLVFFSPLYQFIFMCWPFFAVMTVTAYIFVLLTICVSLFCRVHFGKGLPRYLQATEELEGEDFTPVYFANDYNNNRESFNKDVEKSYDEKSDYTATNSLSYLPAPKAAMPNRVSVYSDGTRQTIKLSSTPPLANDSPLGNVEPVPRHNTLKRSKSTTRSEVVKSVYSDSTTVKMSTTPPLVQSEESPLARASPIDMSQTSRSSSLRRNGESEDHTHGKGNVLKKPLHGLPSNPRPDSNGDTAAQVTKPGNYF